MIGKRDVTLEMPDGATIAQLRDRLGEEYPVVQPFLTTLVCAVDEEYVPSEHVLQEGEDVALIPPISGGAQMDRSAEDCITRNELSTYRQQSSR
jgi:molybdopterin converting factor small subunit